MRRPSTRIAVRSLVLVLAHTWTLVAAAGEFVFDGKPAPTDISGVGGNEYLMQLDGPKALKTLQWDETRDHPCHVSVWGRNLNSMALEQSAQYHACGSGAPLIATDNALTVGFPKAESEAYIAGVSVCLNSDGDRVKGVKVRGRVPGADGKLVDAPGEPHDEYANCKTWKRWVECPEGSLASGVLLQVAKGKEPKNLTGLRLMCSKVAVQAVTDIPPKLTGPVNPLDEISGVKGDLDELPLDGAEYALDTVFWGERRDHPCLVRAEGRKPGDRNTRDTTGISHCGGDIGTGSQSRMDLTVRDRSENAFISGVRVCMNNGRVKGMEFEIRALPWSAGDPPKPKPAPSLDNQRGWLLNCMVSGEWKTWVRCPQGQIAVGTRVHFERGNDSPRSMTGLGLVCRAYE